MIKVFTTDKMATTNIAGNELTQTIESWLAGFPADGPKPNILNIHSNSGTAFDGRNGYGWMIVIHYELK
jgi:hypothetical protein